MSRPMDIEVDCVGALAFLLSHVFLIAASRVNMRLLNLLSKFEYPSR